MTISDGYTLTLSSDVATPTFAEEINWVTENNIAAYKKAVATDGYTLSNNRSQIIYTSADSGKALLELGGAVKTDKITVDAANNKIILSDDNFTTNGVTIISNEAEYEFELAENVYSMKFTGSADRDTITNNGDEVIIDGGADIDKILNKGKSSTIYGGAGNDIVSLSSGNESKNMFVYKSGDGKDRLFNFAKDDTIKIDDNSQVEAEVSGSDVIFNIGSGRITVKKGAELNAGITVVDSLNNPIADISGNKYTEYGIIKSETITLAAGLEGKYTADSIDVVDGSQLETGISIESGSQGISLLGGVGKDTLISGEKDFTFEGGKGNDVFVYTGGINGRIADYSKGGALGKDKILLDGVNFRQYDTSKENLILIFDGNHSLTIDGGAENSGKEINFDKQGLTFNDDGIFGAKGKSVSLGGNSESNKHPDSFTATKKYSKVVTIDGSAANYAIT